MRDKRIKYTLTVPLSIEDRDKIKSLADKNYRKLTDQVRLLIREAYKREFGQEKNDTSKTAA